MDLGLSRLSQSLAARAVDWLSLAVSDEDWQTALDDLRRDGRFTSEWMTAKRIGRAAARAQAELQRAQGTGYDGVWRISKSGPTSRGPRAMRRPTCQSRFPSPRRVYNCRRLAHVLDHIPRRHGMLSCAAPCAVSRQLVSFQPPRCAWTYPQTIFFIPRAKYKRIFRSYILTPICEHAVLCERCHRHTRTTNRSSLDRPRNHRGPRTARTSPR